MDRLRHHDTVRSAVCALTLMGTVIGIALNDPRAKHSRQAITPSGIIASWTDGRQSSPDRGQGAAQSWTADGTGDSGPASVTNDVDAVLPFASAAIQLPWPPLQRLRFFCGDDRRYYPDVTECRTKWLAVLAIYP